MDKGYVAGVGGANVDVHGQSFAPLIMRDSNPGRLHLSVGGVTRNILDNLTRLGQRCELVSVVGDDAFGGMLQASCRALGIGCSRLAVRPGHPSSSYISIMDSAGDMLVAMSDMSVLDSIDPAFIDGQLEFLNGARAVVCDGNLPAPALEHLARRCTAPLYIDPVSTTWAKKLLPVLGRFDTIKPNRLEMEVLAGMAIATEADLETACRRVLATGVRRVFVSLGAQGIYYMGPESAVHRRSRPFDRLVNATGAGDATLAGILYASLAGKNEDEVLDFALGAGLVAIGGADTINPEMSKQAVIAMIKEYVQ
ncbi:MAG TPA: MarR family transcriptional regulator [Candidatus Fournierella merdigallinarum]|nr:MarR family transcriptional regulator [Candidatus Fournierella merdigallinarum]